MRLHAGELKPGHAAASVELFSNDPRGTDFVVLQGEVEASPTPVTSELAAGF